MDQIYHTAINWMDRDQVVAHLESVGIACYDSESDEVLRTALRENLLDGTIPLADIDTSIVSTRPEGRHRFEGR